MESLEALLEDGLKDDPETRVGVEAPSTAKGCCLKKQFKLQYASLLLNNLYRDAIDAGLYTPHGHDAESAIGVGGDDTEDGALFILEEALKADSDAKYIGSSKVSSNLIRLQIGCCATTAKWFGSMITFQLSNLHLR